MDVHYVMPLRHCSIIFFLEHVGELCIFIFKRERDRTTSSTPP
uniref:Uncharacterized protein n=1 Tax=Arundo donax TaxID=35708 RepID=A0A0A9PR48_ARUDO